MADGGIIFSAPMVRALLAGRKTQTRRLLVGAPRAGEWHCDQRDGRPLFVAAPGTPTLPITLPHAVGDRLYVRERLWVTGEGVKYGDASAAEGFAYEADLHHAMHPGRDLWLRKFNPDRAIGVPSIHMPRWASRMWLLVTDVRVQRLQEISEEDAFAEGADRIDLAGDEPLPPGCHANATYKVGFAHLWNSLHMDEGTRWEDNPWIYALTFGVNHGNIDQVPA